MNPGFGLRSGLLITDLDFSTPHGGSVVKFENDFIIVTDEEFAYTIPPKISKFAELLKRKGVKNVDNLSAEPKLKEAKGDDMEIYETINIGDIKDYLKYDTHSVSIRCLEK